MISLPSLAAEAPETVVIERFKSVGEVISIARGSAGAVIDITSKSLSPSDLRELFAEAPGKEFRYRVSAMKRHIPWDTEHLDLGNAKYGSLTALTDVMALLPKLTRLTT